MSDYPKNHALGDGQMRRLQINFRNSMIFLAISGIPLLTSCKYDVCKTCGGIVCKRSPDEDEGKRWAIAAIPPVPESVIEDVTSTGNRE